MGKVPTKAWDDARLQWESGRSANSIAKDLGVAITTVTERIQRYGWQRHPQSEIEYKTIQKVLNSPTPEQRNQALETEAERRAAVIIQHRDEWNDIRSLRIEATTNKDFETAKLAKITAETTALTQMAERRAWGIDLSFKSVTSNGDDTTSKEELISKMLDVLKD